MSGYYEGPNWIAFPQSVRTLQERGDVDGLLGLLEQPDGVIAAAAGEALADLGEPRAVEPLLRRLRAYHLGSLSDDELWEWNTLATALAWLESPGSPGADELLAVLEERDYELGWYAGKLLAKMGDRRAIDPLLRRLRAADRSAYTEETCWEWEELAAALGKLRAVEAVDPLCAALPVAAVRLQEDTAWALQAIDDPRAVPALIAALEPHHADTGYDVARGGDRPGARALRHARSIAGGRGMGVQPGARPMAVAATSSPAL